MEGNGNSVVMGILSAAVTILSGLFWFTHLRISQVRNELKEDTNAMREEHEAHLTRQVRANEQIWIEMRSMQRESNDHRTRMQERIGQLPTRDEMKQDLAAMEKRLEMVLRNNAQHH